MFITHNWLCNRLPEVIFKDTQFDINDAQIDFSDIDTHFVWYYTLK